MLHEKVLTSGLMCPECKSKMKEAERRQENGTTFVWFECSRPECKGQWLRKIPSLKQQIA